MTVTVISSFRDTGHGGGPSKLDERRNQSRLGVRKGKNKDEAGNLTVSYQGQGFIYKV